MTDISLVIKMVLPKPTQCTQVNEFLRCINPRQSVYVSPATQCQEVSPVTPCQTVQ